jgi:hypothetical protein
MEERGIVEEEDEQQNVAGHNATPSARNIKDFRMQPGTNLLGKFSRQMTLILKDAQRSLSQ